MTSPRTLINLHDKNITLSAIRPELRLHPSRLEERKEEDTPLMSAAEFGNVEVVEFLLTLGANKEAHDDVLIWISSILDHFLFF